MSIRSVVGINHDYVHRIEDEAEDFVRLLSYYLKSGSPEHAEVLEIRYGFRVLPSYHHSTDCKVEIGNHKHNLSA